MHPPPSVRILQALRKEYPKKGDMDLGSAEETMIGVMLSARTTDVQVLKRLPALRKRFPDWESLASATPQEIEPFINSIGLYRAKARALHGMAKKILESFDGRVPRTMAALVSLPGVGRKTASCVLSYVFHEPAIAVDTHVFRIARRLGWATKKTPEQVEKEIAAIVPREWWSEVNRTFVQFGRDVCKPGQPQCWRCPVAKWCAYTPKTKKPKNA